MRFLANQRLNPKKTQSRGRRKLAMAGAAFLAAAMVSWPTPASAHGVATLPGARTYLCYVDMIQNNQNPQNPACADAVAQSGTTPLYNWFAVLDSNAAGGAEGYVPDGKICSAGDKSPYDFSAYNAARADWPVTHLTAGSTVKIEYSNWAHHPGDFDVYITKDGWSPQSPLAWSDMELVQTVTDPPQEGSAGSDGGHYYWNLQLPQRSGQHMIMIHWIRSDSPENFYSCSDVVFDGGNGEVSGLSDSPMSSEQVMAAAEEFENTQADPVHADHAPHAEKAVDTQQVAAAGESGSVGAPVLAGSAAMVVFAAGAVFYNRRRRSDSVS